MARIRLKDADALIKQRRYDTGYYLAGYIVECALKSCIAKRTERYEFPQKDAGSLYTHNIRNLVKLAGLQNDLDRERKGNRDLDLSWLVVENWTESSRYEVHGQKEATDLYVAIADPTNGVLECIKRYW